MNATSLMARRRTSASQSAASCLYWGSELIFSWIGFSHWPHRRENRFSMFRISTWQRHMYSSTFFYQILSSVGVGPGTTEIAGAQRNRRIRRCDCGISRICWDLSDCCGEIAGARNIDDSELVDGVCDVSSVLTGLAHVV